MTCKFCQYHIVNNKLIKHTSSHSSIKDKKFTDSIIDSILMARPVRATRWLDLYSSVNSRLIISVLDQMPCENYKQILIFRILFIEDFKNNVSHKTNTTLDYQFVQYWPWKQFQVLNCTAKRLIMRYTTAPCNYATVSQVTTCN